jgi:hypothetical protein
MMKTFPMMFAVLAACGSSGKLCDTGSVPDAFAKDASLKTVIGSSRVCKTDKPTPTHLELQQPDATGDKGFAQAVDSWQKQLANAGWTECKKEPNGKLLLFHAGYLKGDDGLTLDVSGHSNGVWWKGTLADLDLMPKRAEQSSDEHRAAVLQIVCGMSSAER